MKTANAGDGVLFETHLKEVAMLNIYIEGGRIESKQRQNLGRWDIFFQ